MRRQHLDRYRALQPRIPRPIHFSHAAGPERRENFVRAEPSSCGNPHFPPWKCLDCTPNLRTGKKTLARFETRSLARPESRLETLLKPLAFVENRASLVGELRVTGSNSLKVALTAGTPGQAASLRRRLVRGGF